MKKYNVFISYSHDDAELIAPVVRLIRTLKSNYVFQDTQDLMPSKPWESQLNNALDNAKIVIVFWCSHSAK